MITNKNKTFSTIPKFHTNCHFEKHRPKRGPSYRMQVLHPRPQSPQGEPVAKPGTLLLIILSNPAELFAGCQGNASVCVIVTSQMLLMQHCDVIHAHDAVDGARMDTLLAKWGHVLNATQPLFIAFYHYSDVIMGAIAFQITSVTIVYSTVYSRRRSKRPSKLRVTGLCAGNSPEAG